MPTKFSWSHTYNSIEPQFMDLFPNTHRCAHGGACTTKCTNGPMPMICAQGTKSSIKFRVCTNIQYGMCCIHTCTCVRNASTLELTRFASKQTPISKEDSSRYVKKNYSVKFTVHLMNKTRLTVIYSVTSESLANARIY